MEIPSLHEGKDDIPHLVEFFLLRYSAKGVRFSSEALDTLLKHPFPGNLPELEHVVQRTLTLMRSSRVKAVDLPQEIEAPFRDRRYTD